MLVQGAYYAAGGGMDMNPRNAWLRAFSGVINTIAPVIQKRAEEYQDWADEVMYDKINTPEGQPLTNEKAKEMERQYRWKKVRYMFGDNSMKQEIMREMAQDKKELTMAQQIKQIAATKARDEENGFSDNPYFMGGPVGQSIYSNIEDLKRNEDGNLGIMVYNEEQGKEVFTPLPEVIRIMNEASRDPNTANGVSDMVDGYAEQSYMLPFKQGLFDYDTNYKNIYNNLVKNGDLETLNEYANLPNRIFRDDFIEMLMNNEYERLGIAIEGEGHQSTMSDFSGPSRRQKRKFQRQIKRLDPNTDGDPNKISKEDAERIYAELKKDKNLNRQYLTTYLTNIAERKWMDVRWMRSDAPNQRTDSPGEDAAGVYRGLGNDPWDYMVGPDGNWKTREREKGGDWIDISNNQEAIDKLNAQWPKAGGNVGTPKEGGPTPPNPFENSFMYSGVGEDGKFIISDQGKDYYDSLSPEGQTAFEEWIAGRFDILNKDWDPDKHDGQGGWKSKKAQKNYVEFLNSNMNEDFEKSEWWKDEFKETEEQIVTEDEGDPPPPVNIPESKSKNPRDMKIANAYQAGEIPIFGRPSVGSLDLFGTSNKLMEADKGNMVDMWTKVYGKWGYSFEVADNDTPRHYVNKFKNDGTMYYGPKTAGMQKEAITIIAPNGKKETFSLDHWSAGDDSIMSKFIHKWMKENLGIKQIPTYKPKK